MQAPVERLNSCRGSVAIHPERRPLVFPVVTRLPYPKAAVGDRQFLAGSVSTRRRQEADFHLVGQAGQGSLRPP